MTSRERVRRALEHRETDRVPVDFGGTVVTCLDYHMHASLCEHFQIPAPAGGTPIIDYTMGTVEPCPELRALMGSDVRRVGLNVIPPEIENDEFVDGFGIRFRRAAPYLYYDVVQSPLEDAEVGDLIAMRLPDPDDPALYAGLRDRTRELYEQTTDAIVAEFGVTGFYEISQKLRGYENLACDLLIGQDFIAALYDRLLELQKHYFKNYIDCVAPYAQIICYADDLGMQDRLQMSPDTYRRVIKPYHKKIFDYIHSLADIKIMLHSCGAVADVIGDLIEAGVDILNPVQVRAVGMEPECLKAEFGGRIAFWGAVDEQSLLPYGAEGEVRAEVSRLIKTLGVGGGYVLGPGHNLQQDTPCENVAAIYRAAGTFAGAGDIKK
jgi:uroporphyrinogen decarboxylase